MNLGLDDKIVLVTGGSSGIGRAIVEAFAREGAVPVILARCEDAIQETMDALQKDGYACDSRLLDLTDYAAVQEAVKEIVATYDGIDVIVNNAGVNDAVGLKSSPEEFVQSLHKNVVHYYALVHYAAPTLIKRKGNIVNIGSKAGVTGQGGTSGYAAAKGAINGLTREWAVDLAEFGVRVNCIIPAESMTPLYERWITSTPDPEQTLNRINDTIPLEHRMTKTQELADMVVFIASERSSHTTGQILFVDGGYVHLDRAYTMDTPHLRTSFKI